MNTYIVWVGSGLTDRYHSGGSAVVMATSATEAIQKVHADAGLRRDLQNRLYNSTEIGDTDWMPEWKGPILDQARAKAKMVHPEVVYIMPNAGCC